MCIKPAQFSGIQRMKSSSWPQPFVWSGYFYHTKFHGKEDELDARLLCFIHVKAEEKRVLNFTRWCHKRFCRSPITSWLWWMFPCPKEAPNTNCITRRRLQALLSWQRSGKNWTIYSAHCEWCLETSKILKTLNYAVTWTLECALNCAVTWTGFKIQHCTVRNPASSSPVLNLPSLQKVVWKEDASQNQHLSSSNFWISIIQASGWLLEGKENIIHCGQWSPWGSERKPAVHPDVTAAGSALRGVQWVK